MTKENESITPRHEAPAEGAGEIASAARALLDACYKADENSDLSDFVDGTLLTRLDKALRARSSAPEAREDAGCAESEVGRAVYGRIEKLLVADPNGWERRYLSHLVESVEEVGGYDGPPARVDIRRADQALAARKAEGAK